MPSLKNRIGIRYGRLIVLKFAHTKWTGYHWSTFWKCQCDCGKEIIIKGDNLQNGGTKSCGCLQQEISNKQRGKNHSCYIDEKHCGKYTKKILKLKEKIRKRDNYICQDCGKTQKNV